VLKLPLELTTGVNWETSWLQRSKRNWDSMTWLWDVLWWMSPYLNVTSIRQYELLFEIRLNDAHVLTWSWSLK
jgi:hypothetical protein